VRPLAAFLLLFGLAASAACGPSQRDLSMRLMTDDLSFKIMSDPVPPVARERIQYKVEIRDSKTGQPIEGGEGQIFASSRDGKNVYDSFVRGPELGTYYGVISFITSGEWAVAIRFRRDSTQKLQRVDWMQEVFPARGEQP
jgi:hypothetical protein